MNPLKIKGTEDTPMFDFNPESGILDISGISMPEDVIHAYRDAINWLTIYRDNPNEKTEIVFKLEYYNSASSKKIAEILLILQEIYKRGYQVQITWYVEDDDERMELRGDELLSLVTIPHEIKIY